MADHRVGQRRPGYVCRCQPWHRPVQIRVHHRRREKATYHPRAGDFPPEPGSEIAVAGELFADNLHRYKPAAGRPAQEHLSHAARPEPSDQPVRPDLRRITVLEVLHPPTPGARQ